MITVDDLNMTYKVPVRPSGVSAAVRSLFKREFQEVSAVRSVSFTVRSGELVGFLGPNGAGKTTTMKILSGILHPTGGQVNVSGFIPWKREYPFLHQIAVIRGSRPIAIPGELTVEDALRFQKLVYAISDQEFKINSEELVELLELAPLMQRQVRGLSLGERMRAGLAWSLVYRPKVLFLDEPTLGLDVSAIRLMRKFLADYNRNTGATVLLTSHYMADVETLCDRVIIIDKGELIFDGELEKVTSTFASYKLLKVVVEENVGVFWDDYGEVVSIEGGQVCLRVLRDKVPDITSRLLAELCVLDMSIYEPPLETLMDEVYKRGVNA